MVRNDPEGPELGADMVTQDRRLPYGLRGVEVAPPPTSRPARKRWLEARHTGLGATDVGVILGLSPWSTPLEVYLEKTGELPLDTPPTEVMEWGTEHEGTIARVFERRHAKRLGVKVRKSPGLIRHEEYPWLMATPDRILTDPETGHAVAPLEIKTAGHFVAREWDEGVPLRYLVQVLVQMAVTGLDHGYIVPLFGGNRMPEPFRIDWDADTWDMVVEVTGDWWEQHIVRRVPPEPTLPDAPLLPRIWPGGKDPVPVDDRHAAMIAARKRAAAIRDRAADKVKRIDHEMKMWLGDAAGATDEAGNPLVTWSRFDRRDLDVTALKKDQPDIYDRYVKTTPSGRLNYRRDEQ